MLKEHFISFLAAVSDQGIQFVKLYPEGSAGARFKIDRVKKLYAFCYRHGLFQVTPAQRTAAGSGQKLTPEAVPGAEIA